MNHRITKVIKNNLLSHSQPESIDLVVKYIVRVGIIVGLSAFLFGFVVAEIFV